MSSAKVAIRKSVKSLLATIPANDIQAQSIKITKELSEFLKPYKNIACYMSMDQGEVDTKYILQELFKENKEVFLPRCTTTKETGHQILRDNNSHHPHLTFHRMESWEQIKNLKPQGKYQLREPEVEEIAPFPPKLDVILVPGVAFNLKNGARMGHGAGYYDDFFHRYKIHHHKKDHTVKPILIGLSLKQQIIDILPIEKHDYLMDGIVTGDGVFHWIN
ncbi:hypothetical protein Kpol_265p3 [Vanderwaltozyma polyspora DSM 70294]|uniref:5-formyltetrahydrofolate cyclo-ligase n=1 Tax=Vanderwaltozyma polyspora (strain ATCC 22028 / DSM 70294 / BCRC 21397 / CBS 2163 / NBRC 10782 / NRRL Y-8283 / UCD 57-17) TaxID=436907 RepID=A7TT80_VANPO|nr:uncharacterized protein Kpol_265p3 [Vanderwaltozyma polyspora DSM 70294]EDO14528.1 hypothetical protein Kpol_265p3 [Vanderwaltozyma polyspora DSM 70294]